MSDWFTARALPMHSHAAGPRLLPTSHQGPADTARHGLGCHSTQASRAQSALDDVASNVCQAHLELHERAGHLELRAHRQTHSKGPVIHSV